MRAKGGTAPGRRNAVVAGVLLIVATAASLLSGPFLAPVTGSDYLTSAAAHSTRVGIGVLLGFIAAFAAPGIAVALYPVLRGFGEGLALGSVGFRIIEGMFYALGMAVLLSISTLSKEFVDAGAPAGGPALQDPGAHDAGAVPLAGRRGTAAGLRIGGLLYYLVFYRSRLIPVWLSVWGIVGAVLLMVAAVLIIFGVIGAFSTVQVVLAAPIGVQEMVLAVWLIGKGFERSALVG